MLTKEERKLHHKLFYDGLTKYMKKYKSSNGRRIQWLKYSSDVQGIYIRVLVNHEFAQLCFDIQSKDAGVRTIIWEQMIELKKVLESSMNWETLWIEKDTNDAEQSISRIAWRLEKVSLFNSEDYSKIYEFLKLRFIEFDLFYQEFKEILINLVN